MAGLTHEKPEKPLCLLGLNLAQEYLLCRGFVLLLLLVFFLLLFVCFLSPTGLSPSFSVFSLLSCCNKGLKNPETKKSVEILLKSNSRQDLSDIRSSPKAAA